ncbi:MAG: fasciclin domain-containing protein [Rubricoccaceae bacterium]
MLRLVSLFFLTALLVGCSTTSRTPEATLLGTLALDANELSEMNTIPENAMTQDELATLVSLLDRADLVGALNAEGPYTVFAPINQAFDIAQASTMTQDELQEVLKYHVVSGEYEVGDFVEGLTLQTLEGGNLAITTSAVAPNEFQVNNVDLIYTDIEASNGVIHLIPLVLNPASG